MYEYIKRTDIMDKLTASEVQKAIREMDGNEVYSFFLALVSNEPADDMVEVVRCGECERRDKGFVSANDTICCPYMEAFMRKDDFCSYGERKEG